MVLGSGAVHLDGDVEECSASKKDPHPDVAGEQQVGGFQVGFGGQVRDLFLIAGEQSEEVGVDTAGQVAALGDQVLAIVQQRPQVPRPPPPRAGPVAGWVRAS